MKWIIGIVVLAMGADAVAQGCGSPGGGYGGYYYRTSFLGTGLFPQTRFQPTVRYAAPVRYFSPTVRYSAPVRYTAPAYSIRVPDFGVTVRYDAAPTTYVRTASCATPPPTSPTGPPPDYGGYSERNFAPMAPPVAARGRFDTWQCPGGF
jgi:hypothetical protein